jgi:ParB family chromosome partitioning protein
MRTSSVSSSSARTEVGVQVHSVPLQDVVPSVRNPRRRHVNIDELAASIQAYGLLQPVVVRVRDGKYEVIAGHRRLEAARLLGWTQLPVVVRREADDDAYLLTLVENLQRDDLSPREEASALEVLLRERRWSTVQVARAINRSQPYVSKRLRVFEDPVLAPAVLADKLGVSLAEELLSVPESRRYELLQQAVDHRWDRQRLRQAAKERKSPRKAASTRPPGLTRRLLDMRTLLRDIEPSDLTGADRRALRLLFADLSMLGRAPTERRQRVFPALPAS